MTTTPKYTEEQFTAALEQAVQKRGENFVYPQEWKVETETGDLSCVYYRPEQEEAACLIGVALEILGEDVSAFPNYQATLLLLRYLQPLTSEVVAVAARRAQEWQDDGGTWGDALAAYHRHLTFVADRVG